MEKSFAKILRSSRLSSFDPSIPQVYVLKQSSARTGDWGFKRNLPTVIRTNLITVQALDTAEHQTPWRSAQESTLFVKCWKENFPASNRPAPQPEKLPRNIAAMRSCEWKHFLSEATTRKAEWHNAKNLSESMPLLTFLEATDSTDSNTLPPIVGPIYSSVPEPETWRVKGRVLNHDRAGFAVGIAGVVAFLPRNYTFGYRTPDRKLRDLYVRRAEIDPRTGALSVEVSLNDKGNNIFDQYINNGESTWNLQREDEDDVFDEPRNQRKKVFDEIFASTEPRRQIGAPWKGQDTKLSEDSSHGKLVGKIMDLFKTTNEDEEVKVAKTKVTEDNRPVEKRPTIKADDIFGKM
ncbi:hypothetical protein BC937DRAFT_95593 [Endogone sp. FLAS-F59071]|nr:hypothetical protein BC937DRAFT_95593 [Endogone sp. FLAS-F59071]|eukprot:RUS20257.1 hypothetical protein BC937DRAFT_95593 [Endogone sp. FLAS-F59071]